MIILLSCPLFVIDAPSFCVIIDASILISPEELFVIAEFAPCSNSPVSIFIPASAVAFEFKIRLELVFTSILPPVFDALRFASSPIDTSFPFIAILPPELTSFLTSTIVVVPSVGLVDE